MPAFAPREARRLDVTMRRVSCAAFWSALVPLSLLGACSAGAESRAKALDGRYGTGIFSWLVAHEPSNVDVAGADRANVASLDPRAGVALAETDSHRACAAAKARHAVLFVIYPSERLARARAIATALDCGYAIARDEGGIVIAPR